MYDKCENCGFFVTVATVPDLNPVAELAPGTLRITVGGPPPRKRLHECRVHGSFATVDGGAALALEIGHVHTPERCRARRQENAQLA